MDTTVSKARAGPYVTNASEVRAIVIKKKIKMLSYPYCFFSLAWLTSLGLQDGADWRGRHCTTLVATWPC